MGGPTNPATCLSAAAIVLERLLRSLGSVAMDTGTTERGEVAGPRRATHGPAVGHRNLVGCSKKAAMRSRMVRQREVVPEAAGCMVVACCLVRLGARRSAQAQILLAAVFCATVRAGCCLPLPSHVVLNFSKQPPARLFGLATARLPCM